MDVVTLSTRARLNHLRRIADALGGTRVLATECGVSTWTVRAWLSGERTPTPLSQERIDELARRLDLPPLYAKRPPSMRRKLDG